MFATIMMYFLMYALIGIFVSFVYIAIFYGGIKKWQYWRAQIRIHEFTRSPKKGKDWITICEDMKSYRENVLHHKFMPKAYPLIVLFSFSIFFPLTILVFINDWIQLEKLKTEWHIEKVCRICELMEKEGSAEEVLELAKKEGIL